MALRRTSRFGFPPPTPPSSQYTVRMVPLTQGVRPDQAWPLLPPGSSVSMTNLLPLDGILVPRSRLSSMNTIRSLTSIYGMAGLMRADGNAGLAWCSSESRHGIFQSNGSISLASFVSAFGLGTAPTGQYYDYAQVFASNLGENMLVAACGASNSSLICLYQTGGLSSGAPLFSYLTSAPPGGTVCAFDNYIITFNISSIGAGGLDTRVQWCQRGNPSNWTGEGSGFEDLLDLRGSGMAIRATADNRIILFTNLEIWYGVGAAYPAQFQFFPLDPTVGCSHPRTIVDTEFGLVFVAADGTLRLLARGGGQAQVIVPTIAREIRKIRQTAPERESWAVYDPEHGIYYLHLQMENTPLTGPVRRFAINLRTGEWGFLQYEAPPTAGLYLRSDTGYGGVHEGLFFGNSDGTVYSTRSNLATDSGSTVTYTWRSAPIATDLPGNWKQVTQVDMDYRSTSTSTVTVTISTDGGNTYGTGQTVSLPRAPVAGRATGQMYLGGAFPALEVTSNSTGYELHRVDVTMNLGGRRA